MRLLEDHREHLEVPVQVFLAVEDARDHRDKVHSAEDILVPSSSPS